MPSTTSIAASVTSSYWPCWFLPVVVLTVNPAPPLADVNAYAAVPESGQRVYECSASSWRYGVLPRLSVGSANSGL